jgi:hypothetical protein
MVFGKSRITTFLNNRFFFADCVFCLIPEKKFKTIMQCSVRMSRCLESETASLIYFDPHRCPLFLSCFRSAVSCHQPRRSNVAHLLFGFGLSGARGRRWAGRPGRVATCFCVCLPCVFTKLRSTRKRA